MYVALLKWDTKERKERIPRPTLPDPEEILSSSDTDQYKADT
jgi:hypothetical protein